MTTLNLSTMATLGTEKNVCCNWPERGLVFQCVTCFYCLLKRAGFYAEVLLLSSSGDATFSFPQDDSISLKKIFKYETQSKCIKRKPNGNSV